MATTRIVLDGGPSNLPECDRVHEVDNIDTKVKVCYGAGYEHFSHTGEFRKQGPNQLAVFRWYARTQIAE